MTNFALLQTNIAFDDPKANYENVRKLFASAMAKTPRPDVVVLPEDWSAGFSDKMFHEMEKHCETPDGPTLKVCKDLAKEYHVWVVAGSISTLHADGKMRNTVFLIDRDGNVVGDYSKMHLYSDMDEDAQLTHGDKHEVYDTEFGRVGMMVCYDIRFCELSRIYALKKADVLVVVSNFPNPRVNHWRTLLMARAIENQMFVVACNRVGPSPMGTYCGHSIIIDPWGEVIAEGGDEQEIVTGSIDFGKMKEVRDLIHMFRDRQPQLYGTTLTDPQI